MVGNILEIIKQRLAEGNDVLISGFGKFCVKDKRERRGRNLSKIALFFGRGFISLEESLS